MDFLQIIKSRRSVRDFTDEDVSDEQINNILEAGRWAPSGLNNQPWRFKLVRGDERKNLAECTKYGRIIESAPASIVVFFNQDEGYNRTKDMQSMGACIQNMLLEVHAQGLGAVWLGEILNQRNRAEKALGVPESMELMSVIAFGHPSTELGDSNRRSLEEIII